MINLMALHWGEINIKIVADGIDPSSGFTELGPQDGALTPSVGRGGNKLLIGSNATKGLVGSGGNG